MHSMGFFLSVLMLFLFAASSHAANVEFHWDVQNATFTRLCNNTKIMATVNGSFPGPTLYCKEGDNVTVNVTNSFHSNITIHWHGIRQFLTAWSDGPSYITQCPIQNGSSYVYNFQVIDQRGTLFWHAHISWLRATLHGAIVIAPKDPPPFQPDAELPPIILGEWWNSDVEAVINEALSTGRGYNTSDARTINGLPGSLNTSCALHEMSIFNVIQKKTYLLRIINAALNVQLFFSIANHTFTVVEADAEYTKPLIRDVIVLAPGQTMSVLMTANQSIGNYFMTASMYAPSTEPFVPYLSAPTNAVLSYRGAGPIILDEMQPPSFPAHDNKSWALSFTQSLKSHNASNFPTTVDTQLFYTLSYLNRPDRNMLVTGINNVIFVEPNSTSLLQAYYSNTTGIYETGFPDTPPDPSSNYTNDDPVNISTGILRTIVKELNFGATVQIVFQDTDALTNESHPIHLHGQNFYVVGSGLGNFNLTTFKVTDDPPSMNTVAVPSGGWAVIRFKAINPGVWFMHCHLEAHTSWGMAMAFIVRNGNGTDETLPAPPKDLPRC